MKSGSHLRHPVSRGFTLLELLLVMFILSLVLGAVFTQMNDAQQRMSTEETKLDDFQQARDFVDQFFRDINQIGDPNFRLMDTSASSSWSPALTTQTTYTYASQYINDHRFAIGLVKIDSNELRFEGAVNGVGKVQSVIYMINGSGQNNGPACTLCIQRSQADKIDADPLTGQNLNWGTEVNDAISSPIFRYFKYDGTEITSCTASSPSTPCTPLDYTTSAGAQALASIKTVQINLRIQNPNIMDAKTHQPIESSFEGEVSLNNCSMATPTFPMSCQ